MVIKSYFNKIKALYLKYEKFILPLSFIFGLLVDSLTLRRIDLLFENLVFITNLSAAALVIALFNAYDAGKLRGKIFDKIIPFSPILMQFAFGNLFSAFIIFYVRSGTAFVSWPFLIALAVLFIGNEFFRTRYSRLTFHMSVFFVALFSYSIFILPVLLDKIGPIIFLLSGVAALLALGLMIFFLSRIMPERLKLNLRPLLFSIGGLYIIFNVLYFTNIIPPVPLSLKESGIYHSLKRVYDVDNYIYQAMFEPAPKYLFFETQSNVFHWVPGNPIYAYSAVFSPTNINIPIYHKWSYFDTETGDWLEAARVSFPIIGGTDGGYRGYSYIYIHNAGKWRLDVITARGQVLGRREFTVVEASEVPQLETVYR